ncbi:hypothetical protein R3W88_004204 [Solanum pinnatisectum]|uniref:Uncharacterized protein n=1 Tax=Solanum pinnatisectum TaxID=50273 RepID=A0AAV9K8L6_9SOLN|nr:hypothetical protein R3W88_004204 [Solanum pinnatisectum]
MIEQCGLIDLDYHGTFFTCSNGRGPDNVVWKRLDRAMINDNWLSRMPLTTVTHLPFVSSNHCPLLLEMTDRQYTSTKYFKFLHCWVNNKNFIDTVRLCWDRDIQGHPMWVFHQKMKRFSSTLSKWSEIEFGDIFARVKDFEEVVRPAVEKYIQTNSDQDRSSLHDPNAEYIKFLKLEGSILKQQTQ